MSWPLVASRAARLEASRNMSPSERQLDAEKNLRFYTNLALLVAVVIGVTIIVAHGDGVTTALAAYSAALGLGGVLGFLFGVPAPSRSPVNIRSADNVAVNTGNAPSTVTGDIDTDHNDSSTGPASPAANQDPAEKLPSSPTVDSTASVTTLGTGTLNSSSDPPSNLEQVADWVTKLLLGGGLTQMQRIPPKIWQWSAVVALGILKDKQTSEQLIAAQQAFAAGILVYGFILGFFAGFLITKLQLGKAIS